MSDFLLRMITKSAGVHSRIKPAVPPPFRWSQVGKDVPASVGANLPDRTEAGLSPDPIEGGSRLFIPQRKTTMHGDGTAVKQIPLTDQPAFDSRHSLQTLEAEMMSSMFPDAAQGVGQEAAKLSVREVAATSSGAEIQAQALIVLNERLLPADPPPALREGQSVVAPVTSPPFQREDESIAPPRLSAGRSPSREEQEPEPSVEVTIGRLNVSFEAPQSVPVAPPAPRGFDDYASLRRYSPRAWNR